MGVREVVIAGNQIVLHELDDVYDSVTGRALTGSWVWDSALLLSHWLSAQLHTQSPYDFRSKTVLELGAGAGLPGLTAARLGATRVILTDIGPLVPGLRRNVESNGLGDRVEVSELKWGSEELPSQLRDFAEVDLVLMSDVFFDPEEMAALAKTLGRVCGKETVVWAATEVRPWTGDCLNELATKGFRIIELPSELGGELFSEITGGKGDIFAVYQLIPSQE